jgi:hypothetical protein
LLFQSEPVQQACGLRLGVDAREAERLPNFLRYDVEWPEDTLAPVAIVSCGDGEAIGWIGAERAIDMIVAYGVGAPAAHGLQVGSSLAEIRELLPGGRLVCGWADGWYFSYVLGNEVFLFDSLQWLNLIDARRCEDLPGEAESRGYQVNLPRE